MNKLFEALAAFYGLRRSEVAGLKWDAIDFKNKTITIQIYHDWNIRGRETYNRGKGPHQKQIKPSLPSPGHIIWRVLLRLKEQQDHDKRLYLKTPAIPITSIYIYFDKLGKRIKPGYITQHFPIALERHRVR